VGFFKAFFKMALTQFKWNR